MCLGLGLAWGLVTVVMKRGKDIPMGPVPTRWSGYESERQANERSIDAQNRIYSFVRRAAPAVVIGMAVAGAVLIGVGSSSGA
jgi:hypothetical protein